MILILIINLGRIILLILDLKSIDIYSNFFILCGRVFMIETIYLLIFGFFRLYYFCLIREQFFTIYLFYYIIFLMLILRSTIILFILFNRIKRNQFLHNFLLIRIQIFDFNWIFIIRYRNFISMQFLQSIFKIMIDLLI